MPYFQSIFSFDHIIIGEDNKILGILEAAAEISDERGEDVVRQQAIRSRPLPPSPPSFPAHVVSPQPGLYL